MDPEALVTDLRARLTAALSDRYTIDGLAGQGGMATVFRATDLKHRRPVAIKVLRPELSAAIGGERFLQEIELSARLQHPHIVPLYDSGDAGGILYYVMPFIEGESLRDRLTREGKLPFELAVTLIREVASALSYAHERGIVHRDIKPENIMLSGGHAVVADFGIARALTAAQEGAGQLTGVGLAIGTPAYMSPEQATASDSRRPQRPVLAGLRVLRDGDRQRALRRPHRPGGAEQEPHRSPAEAQQDRAHHAPRGGWRPWPGRSTPIPPGGFPR